MEKLTKENILQAINQMYKDSVERRVDNEVERLKLFNKLLPLLGTSKKEFWEGKTKTTAPDLIIHGSNLNKNQQEVLNILRQTGLFKFFEHSSISTKPSKFKGFDKVSDGKFIITWKTKLEEISTTTPIPLISFYGRRIEFQLNTSDLDKGSIF